jgi:DNA-binding NtrC family response regulator
MIEKPIAITVEARVLVVDDEPSIVDFVEATLQSQGYQVDSHVRPEEALVQIRRATYDLALVDINMPGVTGIEVARTIREVSPATEIIIITGIPDEDNLDPCLQMGLTHFLFKPFNDSQLVYTVYAALHFKRLRSAFDSVAAVRAKGSGLIGLSVSIRNIREEIQIVAGTGLPVLILGATGTGKEIVARDIFRNSSRNGKPFITINCAILGSLAESQLFGHIKGAFTGAGQSTSGFIGSADGGTLFLDEIGELSTTIQAKLLRFLDNGEYNRVGEAFNRHADVRVIAATNRDLEKMCEEGTFREDLYYRLSGTEIRTSPLNERKADVLPLVYHFLDLFGTAQNKTFEISAEAAAALVEHNWPGNVRQLKQALHKITQLAPRRNISLADVTRVLGESEPSELLSYKEAKEQIVAEFDREYFVKILQLSQGSLKQALSFSGMHKKNFYCKIKEIGVAMKDFSAAGK